MCVFVSLQEKGWDHAHTQPIHAAGREADDAHQHRLYHHLQYSVRGRWMSVNITMDQAIGSELLGSVCL